MMAAVRKVTLTDILPLRSLFLQEANCQIRYDACHARGWTDSYLINVDGRNIGYGSVKGQEIADRDTVFEYFIMPPFRKHASELFRQLLAASGATLVECQSNDLLLSSMLFEFCHCVSADTVLFADYCATGHMLPGALVRRRGEHDIIFEHRVEPVGEYVLEVASEVVATGGYMTHYNPPFADLYMEVREECRRRGYASYLLQEVKKECYAHGRVPAARCSLENAASRGALLKAGMRISGFMLKGSVLLPEARSKSAARN